MPIGSVANSAEGLKALKLPCLEWETLEGRSDEESSSRNSCLKRGSERFDWNSLVRKRRRRGGLRDVRVGAWFSMQYVFISRKSQPLTRYKCHGEGLKIASSISEKRVHIPIRFVIMWILIPITTSTIHGIVVTNDHGAWFTRLWSSIHSVNYMLETIFVNVQVKRTLKFTSEETYERCYKNLTTVK